MKLKFLKGYHKDYEKLRRNEKIRVQACIRLFQINPDAPFLKRHALKGKYQHLYSINAGGDLRLLYYEEGDQITFVFVRVGSHSQLYG